MKTKLLALIFSLLVVASVEAQCNHCCGGKTCGLYVSGMAGVNLQIKNRHLAYPGAGVGASLGYKFSNGFRCEAEYAFRYNRTKSISGFGYQTDAKIQSCLGNLIYDIDWYRGWIPYIGGGAGYAKTTTVYRTPLLGYKTHKERFAFQFLGGISYRVMYNTDLGVEVRWLRCHGNQANATVALALKRFF